MKLTNYLSTTLLGLALAGTAAHAGEDPIIEPLPAVEPAFTDYFTPKIDLRARYEYADINTAAWPGGDSDAFTLRGRLGLLFDNSYGLTAYAEYEGTVTADRTSYNAAGVHGELPPKAPIADPESHELNQLWIAYKKSGASVKVGRQAFVLDGQRYVGGVAWRQNMQTFDGGTATYSPIDDLTLTYGYFYQVNRIFGSEAPFGGGNTQAFEDANIQLFNAAYKTPLGKLVGYAYFMDLGEDSVPARGQSSNSYGISLAGSYKIDDDFSLPYYGEIAYQTEASNSTLDYETLYYHVTGGVAYKGYSLGVGYESLGSDNGVGFNFPLGTNHKFNGFADRFLNTPGTGLEDFYVYAGAKLPFGINFKTAYHYFTSETGGIDYGQEIDFVLSKKIFDVVVLAKYAYYDADTAANNTVPGDTTRFSIELNYKF
ncbi:MAG: alginate export family protein [Verrucomicrobiota bacterium]